MAEAYDSLGDGTVNVLIEAANFDPVSIARTARRHKLPSEASRRFERGVDPKVAQPAAARVVELLETLAGGTITQMQRVDFYTSHELLVLDYEAALTRQVPRREGWFNLSTHIPWIGMRTNAGDGAHIEFCRGIRNPVGVKVGPGTTPDALLATIRTITPDNEPGRVVLITRFGAHAIGRGLPPLVAAGRDAGLHAAWVCDPMHGNTETVVPTGGPWAGKSVKTRKFGHILAEVEQAFEIHRMKDSVMGGVHFELTGEEVTECTGGARGLSDEGLMAAYRSRVAPRLNYEQALEMALRIARRPAR